MIATLHDLFDHKFYDGDIYLSIKNLFVELSVNDNMDGNYSLK